MKLTQRCDLFRQNNEIPKYFELPIAELVITKTLNDEDMELYKYIKSKKDLFKVKDIKSLFMVNYGIDITMHAHLVMTMVNFKDELIGCDLDNFTMLMDMYCQQDITKQQALELHELLNAEGVELTIERSRLK